MKLFILFITLVTLSTENSFAMGRGRSTDGSVDPTPTPIAVPTPTDVDDVTGGVKVVIQKANNFNTDQLAKLNKAAQMLEQVLNSEELKQKILHHTYAGKETFVDNRGLTNLQIYKMMMAGAEEWPKQTLPNQTVDLFAELYYSRKKVIGYTNQGTSTVYMNSRYFNSYEPGEVAGNMVHEWLHKLGFDHSYYYNDARPYSVPYGVGSIIEDLLSRLH